MQVHFAEQNFFLVVGSLRKHAPEGVAEKRTSPELKALARHGIAADVTSFKADAIHYADINAVRDRVRPLDGAPSVVLRLAEFGLHRGRPSDRRWVKKNACSLQCREARAFGIPLVPADEGAELSGGGVEGLETEIAGSEIKLFVVERIVGNVHLAVDAPHHAIRIEDRGRVVIEAGRALFKERRDQHDLILPGSGGKLLRARAGDGLREIEERRVLTLAEILRLEKFGQADDVCTFSCRL